MRIRALLWTTATFGFVAASLMVAGAHETKFERHKKIERHKQMCVCTMDASDAAMPPIPPIPPVPPVPPTPGAYWNIPVPPGGPNVQYFRHGDGDEDRIVIIRAKNRRDSADTNGDGKVTHREFITRAEKRFKELDEDDDGALSEEEAAPEPMPFSMPLSPPPPMAPAPAAPPAPPND